MLVIKILNLLSVDLIKANMKGADLKCKDYMNSIQGCMRMHMVVFL